MKKLDLIRESILIYSQNHWDKKKSLFFNQMKTAIMEVLFIFQIKYFISLLNPSLILYNCQRFAQKLS
jgi:hypothetical protein